MNVCLPEGFTLQSGQRRRGGRVAARQPSRPAKDVEVPLILHGGARQLHPRERAEGIEKSPVRAGGVAQRPAEHFARWWVPAKQNGVSKEAIALAVARGWMLDRGDSVCLTEAGRDLVRNG